ncbi:MAG: IS1634 family transposase, partial [Nanoarchaeota archaeon]|nr:IS1634 family transposase [Nanoarchaeota archaeon]
YIGREVDGKKILSSSISNIEIESVKVFGPLMILNCIAQEINLSRILGEYGDEILSMVYAHCVEPKSINQMGRWFEKTDLNFILDLHKVTESRLLAGLDSINMYGSERIQKDIFNEVKNRYDIDTSGVLYDVTNTYFYGNKCFWGKRGKSKEKQNDKPLVQIGLGVTRKEGIPLFHKTFDGNIHDSRTLQAVLPMFKEYNINEGVFVYDRGIPSKDNLSDVKNLGWQTICGIPILNYLKLIVRKIIKQKHLVNIKNRVQLSKTAMYAVSMKYQIGRVKGKLLVCFNNKMKTAIQESRYDEIQKAQLRLRNKKNIKTGLKKYFDKNNQPIQKEITKAEEFDGYSCIFSTKHIPNEEIVKIYFEKDLVEKAFQNLKGVIALRPIRHWLYDRVEGHIFVCYLAYLLLSLLKYKLKKIDISPIEALKELESLYKVYMKDTVKGFELTKLVKLTKKQEDILRAVDKKLLKV